MTLVVDASFVIAALQSDDDTATWAAGVLSGHDAVAPHLMPVEVASSLRRAERLGQLSAGVAALAHGDLGELGFDLYPYEPFAERVWEMRHTITSYDAWYIAIAEALDAPLATLDRRLARAKNSRCGFITPP